MHAYSLRWLVAASLTPWLISSNALASALGFSDLNISGSVALSTVTDVTPFSDGEVSQVGEIRTTLSGVTTKGTFATTPGIADGANDATTVSPTVNPLSGSLNASGDGVGYSTAVRAMNPAGLEIDYSEGYVFRTEFGIHLQNTSALNTYEVSFELDYSHRVQATGNDSFANSTLALGLAMSDLFESDILSDSLFGDIKNDEELDTYGAEITDSGLFLIEMTVNPLASMTINANHQWEGAVFLEPGLSDVDILTDLRLVNITCTGKDCAGQSVATPGIAELMASALTGLAWLRRRRASAQDSPRRLAYNAQPV